MMRDKLLTHRSYVNASCKKLGLGGLRMANHGGVTYMCMACYSLSQIHLFSLVTTSTVAYPGEPGAWNDLQRRKRCPDPGTLYPCF